MPKINRKIFFLTLIILIGAFLRFYKLDWGDGLFTHPDEYHIVASVNQLSYPTQMHPHFFSYGTVTIYLIYFAKQLTDLLALDINAFIIGRFFSAFFSTITILVVYVLTRNVISDRFSLLSALLVALMPGLIQQAHFATPESALTFFLLTSLLFLILFIKTDRAFPFIFSSIFFGLSLGVKISGLIFAPVAITSIIIKGSQKWEKTFLQIILFSMITLMTLSFSAPFIFLDFNGFKGNLEYEGGLAQGKVEVFYTRQFIGTTPIFFQIEKILPYTLGPSILIIGLLGFMLFILHFIKKPQITLLLLLTTFILFFGFNGILFAKWTRFLAPTFPFFAIFASFFLDKLYSKNRFVSNLLTVILLTTTVVWTIAFFSIYLRDDIRVTASKWIEENINNNSTFLVEGGNMVDIPIAGEFKKISLDFYSLEQDANTRLKIAEALEQTDYFLVQSRRVFLNHQRLPEQFPETASFYNVLFNGSLGFKQIKQFDSFPSILGFKINDEQAEETWSVFDHPAIRVYQKERRYLTNEYRQILNW